MSKSRHTEAQMIGALKQLEAGRKAEDVARKWGCRSTRSRRKTKYGGMDVSQAQEAKQLRDESTKLRKLVAHLSLTVSWFQNLFDARRKIAAWQKEYNEDQPHSSLGYKTPKEFAAEAANFYTA